ncbi:uncharacterized protein LOC121725482 [Aricia agestis]|uniref:uncharacterized protein LOC121725482 n=1 Tax=Aricia agestis TaxID=91739 RepID=UPI001C204DD8|nr:uncharacterized protein LOC121725482 [Aricia agestis]
MHQMDGESEKPDKGKVVPKNTRKATYVPSVITSNQWRDIMKAAEKEKLEKKTVKKKKEKETDKKKKGPEENEVVTQYTDLQNVQGTYDDIGSLEQNEIAPHVSDVQNVQPGKDIGFEKSPVPYFTEEERTYWENNNNILESSDSEDYTVQENENQALNDNISTEDPITNTYNEQQIHTKLATNRDQNLILNDSTIIVNNDPLLSSNTGPDSCIVALNNLDSFLQSPVMSSNNAPNSSIASLLDINGINSIPPSPLDNGTPGTSLLSIQSPPSITSTPRSRINNNVNKKDKGPPTSSIASLLDIDGINSIPPSPLDNGTPGTSLLSIQSPPSVASTTRSRINNNENKKDKGRGRRVHKDQWKDVKRKLNRNTGKCYFSRDGTERPGRIIKAFCNKCKFHCPQKFTDELRKKIFDSFWSIGNNVRQWDFISKYCKKINKRRRTTELPFRRQYTITYSLPIVGSPVDPVPVCKVMFLNTLGIGAGMVTTALKKIEDSGGIITADARGGRNNRQLVIDAEMIKSVCDHVNNFQPVESHYVRSRTSKLYLDESLSYSRMFLLYKEWVVDNSLYYSNPAKTLRQYRDIVNTNFNLGFHAPRKDQCDVCHVYKNLPKPVPETEFKTYTDHIRNKEIARELKNKYKELSVRDSDKTLTTTYDFQKIHGIPHGQARLQLEDAEAQELEMSSSSSSSDSESDEETNTIVPTPPSMEFSQSIVTKGETIGLPMKPEFFHHLHLERDLV